MKSSDEDSNECSLENFRDLSLVDAAIVNTSKFDYLPAQHKHLTLHTSGRFQTNSYPYEDHNNPSLSESRNVCVQENGVSCPRNLYSANVNELMPPMGLQNLIDPSARQATPEQYHASNSMSPGKVIQQNSLRHHPVPQEVENQSSEFLPVYHGFSAQPSPLAYPLINENTAIPYYISQNPDGTFSWTQLNTPMPIGSQTLTTAAVYQQEISNGTATRKQESFVRGDRLGCNGQPQATPNSLESGCPQTHNLIPREMHSIVSPQLSTAVINSAHNASQSTSASMSTSNIPNLERERPLLTTFEKPSGSRSSSQLIPTTINNSKSECPSSCRRSRLRIRNAAIGGTTEPSHQIISVSGQRTTSSTPYSTRKHVNAISPGTLHGFPANENPNCDIVFNRSMAPDVLQSQENQFPNSSNVCHIPSQFNGMPKLLIASNSNQFVLSPMMPGYHQPIPTVESTVPPGSSFPLPSIPTVGLYTPPPMTTPAAVQSSTEVYQCNSSTQVFQSPTKHVCHTSNWTDSKFYGNKAFLSNRIYPTRVLLRYQQKIPGSRPLYRLVPVNHKGFQTPPSFRRHMQQQECPPMDREFTIESPRQDAFKDPVDLVLNTNTRNMKIHNKGSYCFDSTTRIGERRFSFSRENMMCPPFIKQTLETVRNSRLKSIEDEESRARRHIKSLLNKLTIELFERVSTQLANSLAASTSEMFIRIHAEEVFLKAISEPNFSDMYADLIIILFARSPNFVIKVLPNGAVVSTKVRAEEVLEFANIANQPNSANPTPPSRSPLLSPQVDENEISSLPISGTRRLSLNSNNILQYSDITKTPAHQSTSPSIPPSSPTLSHTEIEDSDVKEDVINFRIEFINRCQSEFNRLLKHNALEFERPTNLSDEDYDLEIKKRKRIVLGNIRFIGELSKRNILRLRITKIVAQDLLSGNFPHEHFIECACELFTTIGYFMERNCHTSEVFEFLLNKLKNLRKSRRYSSRINFKIQDLLELRQNSWRGKIKGEKASTLTELHQKIADEDAQGGSIVIAQKGQFATMGERTRQAYDGYLDRFRREMNQLGKPSFSIALLQAAQRKRRACNVAPSRSTSPSPRSYRVSRTTIHSDSKRHSIAPLLTNMIPSLPTPVSIAPIEGGIRQPFLSEPLLDVAPTTPLTLLDCHESPSTASTIRRSTSLCEPVDPPSSDISEETLELIMDLQHNSNVDEFVEKLLSFKHSPEVLGLEFSHMLELAAWENGPKGWVYVEIIVKLYNDGNVSPQRVISQICSCLRSLDDHSLDNPQAPQLFGRLIGSLTSECLIAVWDLYFKSIDPKLYQPRVVAGVEELLRVIQFPNHPVVLKFAATLSTLIQIDDNHVNNDGATCLLSRSTWVASLLFAVAIKGVLRLGSIDSLDEAIQKLIETIEKMEMEFSLTIYHITAAYMITSTPKSLDIKKMSNTLKKFNIDSDSLSKVIIELIVLDVLRRRSVSSTSFPSAISGTTSPWIGYLQLVDRNLLQPTIAELSLRSSVSLLSLVEETSYEYKEDIRI